MVGSMLYLLQVTYKRGLKNLLEMQWDIFFLFFQHIICHIVQYRIFDTEKADKLQVIH